MDASDIAAVAGVFDSRWLGLGGVTADFERAVGEYVGRPHVLATNTGTSAIQLALLALGIGAGHDVLIPSLTFVATGQAVGATGAKVVLCDVDQATLNVTVETLEAAVTPSTQAVIPVAYRGLPVDIDAITDWARSRGIRVIEDAAHAFGSIYDDGTPVGGKGDICCFSFDPIKNLTCGEGGAIVFSNEAEFETGARLRVLGIDSTAWSRLEAKRPWEYDVTSAGYRFHMPNFCAAIGLSQLKRMEAFRAAKCTALSRYQELARELPHITMLEMDPTRVFPFLAVVMTDHREQLMQHLKDRQIGSGVQYQPMHTFSQFKDAVHIALPATENVADRILSLPLLNDQTSEETSRVMDALTTFAP
jgi:dTDP-4-amino-4,6-dideoxygalactose transaminase